MLSTFYTNIKLEAGMYLRVNTHHISNCTYALKKFSCAFDVYKLQNIRNVLFVTNWLSRQITQWLQKVLIIDTH